jgi:hypothetical protein
MLKTIGFLAGLDPWDNILRAAAGIKTPISLIAVVVIALVIVLQMARRTPGPSRFRFLNTGLFLIAIVGLVPFAASWYIDYQNALRKGIYRVRVTVQSPSGVPAENARIWSSLDAVPKKVDGGWELDVPSGANTAKGTLEIYSRDNETGAFGSAVVSLGNSENLDVILSLKPPSSTIRGTVKDGDGHALGAVRVTVVGYASEAISTDNSGGFVLESHVADGGQVKLHFERPGYSVVEEYYQTGQPISVSLTKQ